MGNRIEFTDVYTIVNEIVEQATGRKDLVAIDTSSFVTVGETLLRTATENTLNAISTVIAKTIFSARPYKGKFEILRNSQERWGAIIRKVITLPLPAEESQNYNTISNPNTLDDGNSIDHYKIRKPKVLQLNFYGSKVLTTHITKFQDQLSQAFHSEAEFIQFMNSVMVSFFNDIERMNENESRLVVLNSIAGISAMGLTEVNLTKEFNDKFGTSYTSSDLMSTHLADFTKFFVAEVKKYSDRLTDSTALYHANLTGYPEILHHTPKAMQKMIMYAPLFTDARANVLSNIFNPEYLEIGDFEPVNFWQDPKSPMSIKIKPNILDVSDGKSKTHSANIQLDNVVGILFDREFMGIYPQFETALTTPVNASGVYYNTYFHWRFNSFCDYTENAVSFVLKDEVSA